jgi:SAM-dependent methyltransferase
MTRDQSIIDLGQWLTTAPGEYLLRWEQDRLDHAVADAFGFHALQLGLPQVCALRANRMPHRWVATDSLIVPEALALPQPEDPTLTTAPPPSPVALHCEFDALPFPNQSIDLVVLPHALELARDAHAALREVERVLVPEGRVVITGFNPASLWGLRQRAGHLRRDSGLSRAALYLPHSGSFIGYWRLRDWLRLLGFEVEGGRFGGYRLPLRSGRWLARFAWMDAVGDRWWPVFGAAYFISAVKRVRGMRLVGLAKTERRAAPAAQAAVNRETEPVVQQVLRRVMRR